MTRSAPLVAFVIAAVVGAAVAADETEKIGQVRFPVSCSASVQKPFERAVALLHSFWYLESAKAFTAVAQADPDCAMAYWGLALSSWTQIWSPPPPAALKRGWEAVEKATAAGAKTPRERDFVAAAEGLPAARRYAQFAPSVPHALHMPSHIYVLLGMWPETIQGNLVAAAAEKDRGNPDDRMHALDYLVYAYLQQAQDVEARRVLDEARGIMTDLAARKYDSGRPTAHFAMAGIEARWALERGRWAEAAANRVRPRMRTRPPCGSRPTGSSRCTARAELSSARATGTARRPTTRSS